MLIKVTKLTWNVHEILKLLLYNLFSLGLFLPFFIYIILQTIIVSENVCPNVICTQITNSVCLLLSYRVARFRNFGWNANFWVCRMHFRKTIALCCNLLLCSCRKRKLHFCLFSAFFREKRRNAFEWKDDALNETSYSQTLE